MKYMGDTQSPCSADLEVPLEINRGCAGSHAEGPEWLIFMRSHQDHMESVIRGHVGDACSNIHVGFSALAWPPALRLELSWEKLSSTEQRSTGPGLPFTLSRSFPA